MNFKEVNPPAIKAKQEGTYNFQKGVQGVKIMVIFVKFNFKGIHFTKKLLGAHGATLCGVTPTKQSENSAFSCNRDPFKI